MYNDIASSSVPCQLKQVQQQYQHMHLAKVYLAEEFRGHHTRTVETTFRKHIYIKCHKNHLYLEVMSAMSVICVTVYNKCMVP